MKVVLVDDESRAVNLLSIMLKDFNDLEIIQTFTDSEAAYEFICDNEVDLVFTDVEMPKMNGVEMARRIKTKKSDVVIVFITGYKQYAYDAWEIDALDYLLKPYSKDDVKRAVEKALRANSRPNKTMIEARCFPGFDLILNGQPVLFRNKKAKELLAYLIHHRGDWVNTNNAVFALFEETDEKTAKNYYNVVIYRLKNTLQELGIQDLLITEYGKSRVRIELINSEYDQYLNGAHNLFRGEYMQDYSWAESTVSHMILNAELRRE